MRQRSAVFGRSRYTTPCSWAKLSAAPTDSAVVLEVFGQIHGGHAASTDLPLDGVAVGEGGLEAVKKVRHCVLAPLATVLEYMFGS